MSRKLVTANKNCPLCAPWVGSSRGFFFSFTSWELDHHHGEKRRGGKENPHFTGESAQTWVQILTSDPG